MTTWTPEFKHPISYLLLEDGSYLLLETSDKIVLEQTGKEEGLWVETTKH